MFRRPLTLKTRHLHLRDAIRVAEGAHGHVLARSLVRHRYLPFGTVPAAEREPWIRLQLSTWQPFAETRCAASLSDRGLSLWAWDADAFRKRVREAGMEPDAGPVAAETLLLPRRDDGAVLQACSEGVEGQVWRAGELMASRWWPQPPEPDAWRNFLRGAGVAELAETEQTPPEPVAASHGQAWASPFTLESLGEQRRWRRHAVLACLATALAMPTLWLLHAWTVERQALDAIEPLRAKAVAEAAPVARTSAEALKLMAAVETYQALVERPDMLALMAHLAQRLPTDGTRLRRLDWDGRQLRLLLDLPAGATRIGPVKALEEGGWLQDVREDAPEAAAPGQLGLVARLGTPRPGGQTPGRDPAAGRQQ